MGVEAPSAEAVENAENAKYQQSAYLDEVNAVKEEIQRAKVEDRKPNLKDFHPTALEAAGVTEKGSPIKVKSESPAENAPNKEFGEQPAEVTKPVAKKSTIADRNVTKAKKAPAKKAPAKKAAAKGKK